MAAPQSLLRRWKTFFGAFDPVDAAVEATDPELCREFRRARGDIVELLCDTTDDDKAESLCEVLDDMMADALEALLEVHSMSKLLLVTTDLAQAVAVLQKHDSERVRLVAGGIAKALVHDDIAKVRAAVEKIKSDDKTTNRPTKIIEPPASATAADIGRAKTAKVVEQPPLPKAKVPVDRAVRPCFDDAKMAITKRKLHEGYEEAENAKRQRRVQVIKAPETEMTTWKKQQRKTHPIMRERSRARCGSSMVKRSRARCGSSMVKRSFSFSSLTS